MEAKRDEVMTIVVTWIQLMEAQKVSDQIRWFSWFLSMLPVQITSAIDQIPAGFVGIPDHWSTKMRFSSIIINDTPFHYQKYTGFNDKLYGHPSLLW